MALAINGDARAYPANILNAHEIVNHTVGGDPVAVTYCPLCGSGLAFRRIMDGETVAFGVSGLLHENDLMMYDRRTESLWQQITGEAIVGPKAGWPVTCRGGRTDSATGRITARLLLASRPDD